MVHLLHGFSPNGVCSIGDSPNGGGPYHALSHHQQGRVDFNTVHREGFSFPLSEERLMMRECSYSTKTREVLGNPSSPPSRFALGKPLGSQEISRASRMDFPIPPSFWWSMDTIRTPVNLFNSQILNLTVEQCEAKCQMGNIKCQM